MQSKIPVMSGKSNLGPKREVDLLQYGGLLFQAVGTGFVRYYISLVFSRKTANLNVKTVVL